MAETPPRSLPPRPPTNVPSPADADHAPRKKEWMITKKLALEFISIYNAIRQREQLEMLLERKDKLTRDEWKKHKDRSDLLQGAIWAGVSTFKESLQATKRFLPRDPNLPRNILRLTDDFVVSAMVDKRSKKVRSPADVLDSVLRRAGIATAIAGPNDDTRALNFRREWVKEDWSEGEWRRMGAARQHRLDTMTPEEREQELEEERRVVDGLAGSFNVLDDVDYARRASETDTLIKQLVHERERGQWFVDSMIADPINNIFGRQRKYGADAKIPDSSLESVRKAVHALLVGGSGRVGLPGFSERDDKDKVAEAVLKRLGKGFFEKVYSTWRKQEDTYVLNIPSTMSVEEATALHLVDFGLMRYIRTVLDAGLLSEKEAIDAGMTQEEVARVGIKDKDGKPFISLQDFCKHVSGGRVHTLSTYGLTQQEPEFERIEREQALEELKGTVIYRFGAKLKDMYANAGNATDPTAPGTDEAVYLRILGELASKRFSARESLPQAVDDPQKRREAAAAKRTTKTDRLLAETFDKLIRAGVFVIKHKADGVEIPIEDVALGDSVEIEIKQPMLEQHASHFIKDERLPDNVSNVFNAIAEMLNTSGAKFRKDFVAETKRIRAGIVEVKEESPLARVEAGVKRRFGVEISELRKYEAMINEGLRSEEELASDLGISHADFLRIRDDGRDASTTASALGFSIPIVERVQRELTWRRDAHTRGLKQELGKLSSILLSGKGWTPELTVVSQRLLHNIAVLRAGVTDIRQKIEAAPGSDYLPPLQSIITQADYLLRELDSIEQETAEILEDFVTIDFLPEGNVVVTPLSEQDIARSLRKRKTAVMLNTQSEVDSPLVRNLQEAIEKQKEELNKILAAIGGEASHLKRVVENQREEARVRERENALTTQLAEAFAERNMKRVQEIDEQLAALQEEIGRLKGEGSSSE